MYYALVGISTGWITAFPAIRPWGVPVPYFMLLALALVGMLSRRNRIDGATGSVIAGFLATIAYVVMQTALLQDHVSIGAVGRTLIGFTLFALIAATVKRAGDVVTLVLCMAPFWFISQAIAIAQYFGVIEAIALPILLLPEEVFEEDEEISLTTIRIFGLLGLPHVFAYGSALFTLLVAAVLPLARGQPLVTTFLRVAAAVSLVATILSAQRTAAWPTAVFLIAWAYVASSGLARAWVVCGVLVGVLGAVVAALHTDSESLVGLQRLTSLSVGADDLRMRTWGEGLRAVLGDPLGGTSYESARVGAGIHNGFLRGWAQFGMPWLLLILSSFTLLLWKMLAHRQHLRHVFLPVCIFISVILNSMFHTPIVTINDLVTWPFLSLALVLSASQLTHQDHVAARVSRA